MLTLVFMLSFSSMAFGMTAGSLGDKTGDQERQKSKVDLSERLLEPENPNETIRIIVELEKAPTIEAATNKGILYKDMSEGERVSLESAVESNQVDVQAQVKKVAPSIEILEKFTTVVNGFSAKVKAKEVQKISLLRGVKAVHESTEYERPVEQPDMTYSNELVQATHVWNNYGFTGEGMVVGIIDTGIDPTHRDMVLSDDTQGAITETEVSKLLTDGSIEAGKYFTSKVPFGYNYMDGNNEIKDLGPSASMHGMHVAGTVGANGKEENGGIKGVAPETQLLALKVFGNDPLYPSTFGDIYIKAIDDAIKLKVDVLNMSLGSTAGYVDANNPEQQAVKRATDNGVLVSISAGNSELYGDGNSVLGDPFAYTGNQDYGLTGAPGVSKEALTVASIENSKMTMSSFVYYAEESEKSRAIYLLANNANPGTDNYEVIDAGLGNATDFKGKDFTGKFALVSRGDIAFVDKGINAQAAGAAGVIIYNNAPGSISMASDPSIKIPYLSTLQENGKAMKNLLDEEKKVFVQFDGLYHNVPNPNEGQMSDFTSWGPTSNLDFKPEITAPGGSIFSTLNNDSYGSMNGTSMAAPHVAGGAALIFQRIEKDFDGISNAKRVQLAKNLLMNTAKPVMFKAGEYVSPRRQGAGLMQLANAIGTDVVVTDNESGEAKVALKQINDHKFSFTLTAKNFSDEEKTYDVKTQIQMDKPVQLDDELFINMPNNLHYGGQIILGEESVTIEAPDKVIIPANGEATITITADASAISEDAAEIYPNGFFLDGFVTLNDPSEEATSNVPLTVPFFGFNGEWDKAPIFDYFAWDDMSYWGYTALADEQGSFLTGGGAFDENRFGFSPNGDGIRDKVIPVYSLFRNTKELKVSVVDKDGKEIRTIRTANELRKHYKSDAATNPYTYNTNNGWDGKVNGKVVADGEYFIQVSGVIDYNEAKWQNIKFPVKVDTVAPTADVAYDSSAKTITVSNFVDNENGTGAEYWNVLLNGEKLNEKSISSDVTTYAVKKDLIGNDNLVVQVWDSANNERKYRVGVDTEIVENPVIYIDKPTNQSVYDTNEVVVSGTVEAASAIEELTINGEKAAKFDGRNFTHTLTFKDGYHFVQVKAVDKLKNEMEIGRRVFVDTTAATLTFTGNYPVKTKEDSVSVTVNIQDNFDEIQLTVNSDAKYSNDLSSPYSLKNFKKDVTVELQLADGKNEFVFEVENLGGHKTTKTFTIEKTDQPVVENPGTGGGYYPPPVVTPTPDPSPIPTPDPKPEPNPEPENPSVPEQPGKEDPKPVTPPKFNDLKNSFAAKEINYLATKGIIFGKTKDKFEPNAQITRAEFAVLLARALDLPLEEYKGTFKDVQQNKKWAYPSIEAAARAGIVNGLKEGSYNPDAKIKREEIAAMVMRAVDYQDKSKLKGLKKPANFKDHNSIGGFAIGSVYNAVALGVIKGSNGNFYPKKNATRAESAVMLYRALDTLDMIE
ncbi:S8 family serine peptidase [Sporosarcina sp. A2]|uniref:S8 family serine peptidase n=1 Tax=Sporosarcina sp. A2 TaxID=3393449 RepID=UPI003D799CEC